MYILLKLKHWVLLTIMVIPPIIINIANLSGVWYLIAEVWTALVYTCWMFSIGNAVYKMGSTSKFAVGLFKTGVVYLIIYLLLVFYDASDTSEFFPIWQIPFHLVAIFIEFYLIFVVAKNLVNYEKYYDRATNTIFITFCALWFFPIGIFFVQPRINRIGAEGWSE